MKLYCYEYRICARLLVLKACLNIGWSASYEVIYDDDNAYRFL